MSVRVGVGSRRLRRLPARLLPHLPALAILGLVAWLYLHRIDTWLIDDDEEGYLYASWRISQGELPYLDFLTPQLPGFLFPGAGLVWLFGRVPVVMRAWSALLVLVSGGATYLVGRRLFGPVAGLAAMTTFLLIDDVFAIARTFRPEATMLCWATLALYVFVRADESAHRRGYALASLLFGLGLLAKLFALLPWAAAAAYLAVDAIRHERTWRQAAEDVAALLVPGTVVVASVMGGFLWLAPETYTAVLGHQLVQGAGLTQAEVTRKTLLFYWRALNWHAPLLVFVPAGLLAIRHLAPRRGWVVAWQLPTVLAFFLLTRQLWARHLVYIMPTLALLFGAVLAWLTTLAPSRRREVAVVVATVVASIVLPHLVDELEGFARQEIGTERLAALVRTLAPPGTRILSDYPGVGFYAGRATTYSGAGLSEGATESGQITGALLLAEMAGGDVSLVLIDTYSQGGHITDVLDYEEFEAELNRRYDHLGKTWRQYQPHEVYLRRDVPRHMLDFGWARQVALGVGDGRVASGGEFEVDLVLATIATPERAFTVFLHLVGPDGVIWGQHDELLTNALYRSTEEWEVGELVAMPLTIRVDPGAPPGRYGLELGLYDRETGERLVWTAPDGRSGEAYRAGVIEVSPPARPPARRELDFGDDAATGRAGPYQLLAARVPGTVQAGSRLSVRLTWLAGCAPAADHQLRVALEDAGGVVIGDAVVPPGGPDWPTSAWRSGEIAAATVELVVDPNASGGPAAATASWLDARGRSLAPPIVVGTVEVRGLGDLTAAVPEIARPLDARLGDRVELLGSDLPGEATAGSPLSLTLFWRAGARVTTAYAVLVHVLDTEGNLVAQGDGPPVGGKRPTTSWRRGEVIADARKVELPADLPPGIYRVLAGLYDAGKADYPRLPATVGGVPRDDGRAPVGDIRVAPGVVGTP